MRVLGMLSGTSHDGVDVALVSFEQDGDALRGHLEFGDSLPYPEELRARLIAALPPGTTTFEEVCMLDTLVGQHFALAAEAAMDGRGPTDLIASHGQTMFHWVDGRHALGTLQIGQPSWIAARTGVPVLSDMRIRDITVGGHGAPLVSFLDTLLVADHSGRTALLNLGGIANVTIVEQGGAPVAYDIGPSNALIDAVVQSRHLNPAGYDEGGRIAASGQVDNAVLQRLLSDPYYELQAPKSTGKEHFNLAYLESMLSNDLDRLSAADLIATLTELTVRVVAQDLARHGASRVLAAGGGCKNPRLMMGLRQSLPADSIALTDEVGVPADYKEAIAFALAGWCTLHGLPSTIPECTGADAPSLLGTLTPGRDGFPLSKGAVRPRVLHVS